MRRLFLVLGPESSGNHLTSLVLKTMGAYWEEPQKLDQFLDGKLKIEDISDNPHLVLRRSVPHGRDWPSYPFIYKEFTKLGYIVKTIILRREWMSTTLSNYYHRSATVYEAWETLMNAERHIARYLKDMDDFYILNTSALMKDPKPVIRGLEIYTGLKWPEDIPFQKVIHDADYGRHSLLLDKGFESHDRKEHHTYFKRKEPAIIR